MKEIVPWDKIISYDADVTCITDSRGVGKTFGMRERFLRDSIEHELNFVQIVRHESRIRKISQGYFDALYKPNADGVATSAYAREHPCVFQRHGSDLLYQQKPIDADEKWKPKKLSWERCGYFVSLSKDQDYKEQTFANVRRLSLDEAFIQHPDRSNNYLPMEFERLVSIVDSTTRERPDSGMHKPNVYLLSNSCSIVNPYFEHYGIDRVPPDGFSWWGNKTFLLYVGNNQAYADEKANLTVAGRMSQGTTTAEMANSNRFVSARTALIEKKTPDAKFVYGMVCNGQHYGVWVSLEHGKYFVNDQIPNGSRTVYALTTGDNAVNYIVARRSQSTIQDLVEAYAFGIVRFSTPAIRERCETEVFRLFGLH